MSGVLPSTKSELLSFCTAHEPVWSENATALGLTEILVGQLRDATSAANDSSLALVTARNAAKAATATDDLASKALRTVAADLVARIKFKAETTSNPSVYTLAQIPAPATPGPAPLPARPDMMKVGLEPSGAVRISWRAANERGATNVVYQVFRKLPGATAFALCGVSGGRDKFFVDQTIPAGSSGVQYIVQGTRGGVTGPQSEILTVSFGVGAGSPPMTFTLTKHDEPVPLAA
jgi:hypothetical protein